MNETVAPTVNAGLDGPPSAAPEPRRWLTRRRRLKLSGGLAFGSGTAAAGYYATRDRIRLGVIGCGHRGSELAQIAHLSGFYLWRHGSVVALADVNRDRAAAVRAKFCRGADVYQDYRHVLSRDDVDAIIVATPDHWHMDLGHSYPVKVLGTAELPSIAGGFDVPADFTARLDFATGQTIEIRTTADRVRPSGLLFEGERSSLWVDRENIEGPAAFELRNKPLPPDAIRLHSGSAVTSLPTVRHLTHFYDVVRRLAPPVSDAETAHRTNVALHLANISIRVGRPVRWDPTTERIIDDSDASALLSPPRRQGYDLLGPSSSTPPVL